ncbi:MAG: UDP-N-acetylglucosamine--N-acetylmuramyl-(pentapeptide) pyrophosphoryl-undecaprenol N-acetylglucosamine transferase [Arenicella sp.]
MKEKKNNIKVIISGGGTGGHIYPAIAIADALKEIDSTIEILFVGAEGKMEMEKVPKAGYKIIGLWISGLQRKQLWRNWNFPFKLASSWLKARKIVKDFQPNAIVGVGGYASAAMLHAGTSKGIPTLIQEQNGYAGLTNKLFAAKVNKVCVAYKDMGNYFPEDKIIFTGNPVRKDILELENIKSEAYQHFGLDSEKKTLLVLGGSLGALTLNESLKAGVEKLLAEGYQVIWQTGKFYYENLVKEFSEAKGFENLKLEIISTSEASVNLIKENQANPNNQGSKLLPFIARMDFAYACADVVISRAGALSISELCLAGKPSIFVPSPNVAEDHQTKNAKALEKENAGILVKDSEARAILINEVLKLLKDETKQNELAQNIKKLAKPNASKQIAEEVLEMC